LPARRVDGVLRPEIGVAQPVERVDHLGHAVDRPAVARGAQVDAVAHPAVVRVAPVNVVARPAAAWARPVDAVAHPAVVRVAPVNAVARLAVAMPPPVDAVVRPAVAMPPPVDAVVRLVVVPERDLAVLQAAWANVRAPVRRACRMAFRPTMPTLNDSAKSTATWRPGNPVLRARSRGAAVRDPRDKTTDRLSAQRS
jgi:hypothetical protein